MKKLELIVSLHTHKSKEFKQSLQDLSKKLQDYSSSFIINESDDALSFSISFRWETGAQMHQALRSEEFSTLLSVYVSLLAWRRMAHIYLHRRHIYRILKGGIPWEVDRDAIGWRVAKTGIKVYMAALNLYFTVGFC